MKYLGNLRKRVLMFLGVVACGPFVVSCTSLPKARGYYALRADKTYDILVLRDAFRPETTAYRGAFELCREEYQSGFRTISVGWERRPLNDNVVDDGFALRVRCEGNVDSVLSKRFGQEPSDSKVLVKAFELNRRIADFDLEFEFQR